ncbi:LacI family DNA-binding transcriptional regulator [Enterobacter sp. SA187]|uniref:LacI family DNA-binding transcriptional regulator n=1 Tax=Enterobacter sp. SA187 TaxID=1914861 RepID=UPI0009341EC7|nr:substrate-binding domain-containing protein [Enterobacter sp. SA187]
MAGKKPTITDVAKLAEVSAATVSMALSGKGRISKWTTERINKAIDELGYVRNNNAATLKSGKTGLIAVLVHGLGQAFNVDALKGITSCIDEHKKVSFIMIFETQAELENRINIALNYNVDGFLIVSERDNNERTLARLNARNIPCLFIASSGVAEQPQQIGLNAHYAGNIATRYLINVGHMHIAFIGGHPKSLDRAEKLAGYFAALKEHNLEEDTSLIIADSNAGALADRMAALFSRSPWVTAMICYDAATTQEVISAIKMRGRGIGKDSYINRDIAIICLENVSDTEFFSPSITCIDTSATQMGWNAARLLLCHMDDDKQPLQGEAFHPALIIRDSA